MSLQKLTPAPLADAGPIEALLACHARIRHFGAMSTRIATVPEAKAEDLADGASRVHRYFGTALPLHVADEDASLFPELAPVADAALQNALRELARQHEEIESLVARLLPPWRRLIAREGDAAETVHALRADATALEPLLLEHLALEEEAVFPHVKSLVSESKLAAVHAAMQGRRSLT